MSTESAPNDENNTTAKIKAVQKEIKTMEEIIKIKKENVKLFMSSFPNNHKYSSLYLTEYENLIHRIHEYEQQLDKKNSKLHNLTQFERELTQDKQKHKSLVSTSTVSSNSPIPDFIRVFLPNNQITTLVIKPNCTLRDLLQKPMEIRNLKIDECELSSLHNIVPFSTLSWDMDVNDVSLSEINVKFKTEYNKAKEIDHELTRYTFNSCDICKKRFFLNGTKCRKCLIKGHQQCIQLCNYSCGKNYKIEQKVFSELVRLRSPSQFNYVRQSTAFGCQTLPKYLTDIPFEYPQKRQLEYKTRKSNISDDSYKSILGRSDSTNEWGIDSNQIKLDHQVGSGAYGTVYKAMWHGPVAVKQLKVENPTFEQIESFKNEVDVLRKTRHANILLFMGYYWQPQLSIVTQWCDASTLYEHIHIMETEFTSSEMLEIAKQIAQGMEYLHAKEILHHDLKSKSIIIFVVLFKWSNVDVFLHAELTIRIGDFGLSTIKTRWKGSNPIATPVGSILWMAPEVIRISKNTTDCYDFPSDVYSYGIILFEIAAGELPYSNISSSDQVVTKISYNNHKVVRIKRTCSLPSLASLKNDNISFSVESVFTKYQDKRSERNFGLPRKIL
ncbi:hypothetical protein A3Q56_07078 [Intoshia linei]|uniref:non-specific serine/threonine protein kinase n=1 Tax=Intoshia linei TaxID=1819745 RepID=A0A177AV09_9BILA|nr:hypothetical protein A3Q56_07078 [Intoshia linei]